MKQMQDWLATRAEVSPNKAAIRDSSGEWKTWQDLHIHSFMYATNLRAYAFAGNKLRHIALLMNSNFDTVAMIFGIMRFGATLVPINSRLKTAEIEYQLAQADCDILIYDDAHAELAQSIDTKRFRIEHYTDVYGSTLRGTPNGDLELDSPLAIIHTSGTSGKPKGAVLTYGNMFYSAMASAYRIGHMPDDKWLCVLPLYHVGGLSILIRAVLYGIAVDLREKFDVDEINHALAFDEITLVSLVPTMLYRLLEARNGLWSPKLRLVLVGGAATTPELVERCKAENIPLATTYGMTEAASQIATTLPNDAIRKVGTVGKPLMFTEIRVVDENGKNQAKGKYGEILVKSPTVMQGYYNDEEATDKAFTDDWFRTGDIGYFDADGDLFLVQRRSDLIVSGGENVYPSEVEAILRKHPSIKEAVVIGLNDPEWGQKVAAAIILEKGASLTEDELEIYSREHLAGYKIPRIIKFVDELPMTGSGKIQRGAVKDLFKADHSG